MLHSGLELTLVQSKFHVVNLVIKYVTYLEDIINSKKTRTMLLQPGFQQDFKLKSEESIKNEYVFWLKG